MQPKNTATVMRTPLPSALAVSAFCLLAWIGMYALYTARVDVNWLYESRGHFAYAITSKPYMWHLGKNTLWPSITFAVDLGLISLLTMLLTPLVTQKISLKQALRINFLAVSPVAFGILVSCIFILVKTGPIRLLQGNVFIFSWETIFQLKTRGAIELFSQTLGPLSIASGFFATYLFNKRTAIAGSTALILGALPHLLAMLVIFSMLSFL